MSPPDPAETPPPTFLQKLPQRVRRSLAIAGNAWRVLPYKFFWLLLVVLFLAEDRVYPLSNYPMYASMANSAHYVYVTDGQGQPIPCRTIFGRKTTTLSKQFRNALLDHMKAQGGKISTATAEDHRIIGEQVLKDMLLYARDTMPRTATDQAPPEVTLHYVHMLWEKNRLNKSHYKTATVPTVEFLQR